MKTNVEAVSGTERKISVEIPAEDITRRVEEQFVEIRKEAPLKGFRKGKAPLDMVKRLFRDSVESDLSERLVRETLSDVVKEKDIKVLSLGAVDAGKAVSGEDFRFSVTVEVVPDVEAKDYKGIPVVRERPKVSDEEVAAAVERLRTPYARFQPEEEGRKTARGDLAEFSFKATSGGETVDENEKVVIVLSNGIPFGQEFEDRMIGVGAGDERSFEVAFPVTHPVPKYAGRTVSFEVKVAAVRERKLPDLDDAFAKQFGAESVEDLRKRMRERLEAEAEGKSRQAVDEQLRKALNDRNVFDVPPTLTKRQTMSMIESTIEHMESSGVDLKKTKLDFDQMSERLKFSAERSVRVGLLIEAISRQESLDVPYSEIEEEMKRMAEREGTPFEKVREKHGDEREMDALRDRLLERKVMNFLLDNAEVKEEVAE